MMQELLAFSREIQTFDIVILSVSGSIWLLVMFYNIQFYLRLAFYKVPGSGSASVPVSVIMIVRNEEENLKKHLNGWLSMGYPNYEILVVDDFSEDNSLTVLGVLRQQHPRLKLTGLNQETRYSQNLR